MQGYVYDGLHALWVGLDDLPGFAVGYVLVADACQVHGLLQCIAEAEVLQQSLQFLLHTAELGQSFAVVVGQFATGRHTSLVVLLGKLQGAVHEVAIDGHQFVVATCLVVSPCEVVVLCLGSVGGEHIAQFVLTAGHVHKVFVEPYCIVLAG